MQVDMHYYGTYVMAKAAGLTDKACKTIATAAEFVDDNAGHNNFDAKDHSHLNVTATAHHNIDGNNLKPDDQRLVWLPFHFLPGAQGDNYEQKLICRKDSVLAQQMLKHHLSRADKVYADHLIGIAAHVYCDTFAHYGFSGISSKVNDINQDSLEYDSELPGEAKGYIQGKLEKFMIKQGANAGEFFSIGLGHGAAHTLPDRPYLKWQFKYDDGRESGLRSNPDTFMEACEKMHRFFSDYGAANPAAKASEPMAFTEIKDTIASILKTAKPMGDRVKTWQGAAAAGLLFQPGRQIPTYDANEWLNELKTIENMDEGSVALELDAFKFMQAAAVHRTYVLRELLPEHGLLVR